MSTPEETAPYGTGPAKPATAAPAKRVRTHHLREMKERGERFSMLTAYEQYAAATFDEAGIEVLLVGDSASNNVYGNETSLPVTVDELLPLTRAVTRSVRRALVVGDLPFGSYQASAEQAYLTAVRFMKEGGAHCVKLEGGVEMAPQIREAHPGRHPGDGPHRLHPAVRAHPRRLPRPGPRRRPASASSRTPSPSRRPARSPSSWRWCPATSPARSPSKLAIPTIGIGAGPDCDGQVLVWQDAFGLRQGRMARFVKQYADLHAVMLQAAQRLRRRRQGRHLPGPRAHLLTLARSRRRTVRTDPVCTCGRWSRDGRERPPRPTCAQSVATIFASSVTPLRGE